MSLKRVKITCLTFIMLELYGAMSHCVVYLFYTTTPVLFRRTLQPCFTVKHKKCFAESFVFNHHGVEYNIFRYLGTAFR